MCGISGFNWRDESLINEMKNEINHRGPNDEGTYVNNLISFGHNRLSILDLSKKGHQPMGIKISGESQYKLGYNEEELNDADVIIVYNGEIYNYLELRHELNEFNFKSNSDTEVVLKAYLKWDFQCVNKFIGMWSFCIYDKRKDILFCSRDRLGQKPFYYYFFNKKFIFCSELKGILVHKSLRINKINNINKKGLELYFSLGYIPGPYTIFNHIYKLNGAHNLIFDLQKCKITRIWKYWELPNYKPFYNKSKLIDEGKKLLKSAITLRLRSDAPLGIFLSGGLDSTSVLGGVRIMNQVENINTFSLGFTGDTDETHYMNLVSTYFKTTHHHQYYQEKDFEESFKIYSEVYDEPFADDAGFPTIFLCKWASKFITVILGGDGGDEIFGGYQSHQLGSQIDIIYRIPEKLLSFIQFFISILIKRGSLKFLKRLKKLLKASLGNKEDFFINFNEGYNPDSFKEWTRKNMKYSLIKGNNLMSEGIRIFDILFNTLQDNFLVKIDRASMFHSLEIRSPYLDHRFFEYAQKIPTKWKQTPVKTKILMRQIIKNLVPQEVLKRKVKMGFTPPIKEWIKNSNFDNEFNQLFIDLEKILPQFVKFYKRKNNFINIDLLIYKFRLLIFYLWWKKWISETN